MRKKPIPQRESHEGAKEARIDKPLSRKEAVEAMKKFRALTRDLLTVSPHEMRNGGQLAAAGNEGRRNIRKRKA
jgi:hypothetical protein